MLALMLFGVDLNVISIIGIVLLLSLIHISMWPGL